MQVTRRYWTVAGLGAFLAVWGVIVANPLPVIGASGVATWLIVRQYQFLQAAVATDDSLTMDLQADSGRITAGESTQLTLAVTLSHPAPLPFDLTIVPPVAAEGDQITTTVAAGETETTTHVEFDWPVAGSFAVDIPDVILSDEEGFFRQTIHQSGGPTILVEPRAPRNVHVGEGGEAVATGFGQHDTGRQGSGLKPAEVRKYVPGDAVRQIDWKATARLQEPHVREFEGETDRETLLFVDHRMNVATGEDGRTKLDYGRQLALAVVDGARELNDPLGLYTVGDGGLTATFEPGANVGHFSACRQHLLDLEPTPSTVEQHATGPATAGEAAARLDGADDPFARTLRPYFGDRQSYVHRFDELPLFAAVRAHRERRGEDVWTVIVTDDSNRPEVREAVKVARRRSGHVAVFLTPSVLYERGGLADLQGAYDRYVAFEEFRKELAGFERVTAFEVGPGDRLSAVLSAGRADRAQEVA